MQVPDLLRNPAKRFPDRLAVIEGSRRLTFAEVDRRADQLAAALQARGIEPGDRVALLAMNELEYLEIQVAAQRLGAILVPLNYRLAVPELDFIVRNSGCRLLIHGPGYEVTAKGLGVADNLHLGPTGHGDSYDEALASHTDPAAFGPLHADTPCTILYTSGTTGRPKGAVLTNLSVYARCAGNALELRVKPGDVFVQTLPMFHIAANLAYSFTYVGATLALVREFSPPTVLEVLRATSATHVLLVPTTINMLNNHPGIDEERFDDLRMVLYGASAIAPDVLRRAIEVFGCGFLQFFGMTETSGCSLLRVHGPRSGRSTRPAGLGGDRRHLVRDPGGRPGRPRVPTGRRGRDRDPRSGADGRLLGRPRRDRRGPPRRMDAHGRPRLPLRGGLPLRERPPEGHDRDRRRERVPARGGGRPLRPSRHPGGRRHRGARRPLGRARPCHRRGAARPRRHHGVGARALPRPPGRLQVPEVGRAGGQPAEERDGQDPQAGAAGRATCRPHRADRQARRPHTTPATSAMWRYVAARESSVSWAFSPLGLGATHSSAGPRSSACRPALAFGRSKALR